MKTLSKSEECRRLHDEMLEWSKLRDQRVAESRYYVVIDINTKKTLVIKSADHTGK